MTNLAAAKTVLLPNARFPEFSGMPRWEPRLLADVSNPVTERVGDRRLTSVSISAGIGFVPQAEKFGRDISGNQYHLYTLIRDGDFVYNKGNSLSFPQGCVYQLRGLGEVAAPNVFISFRLKEGYCDGFFRYCFEHNLHGIQLKRHITSGARSNGLLNISKEHFFGITIPTPSLAEQLKIAECLRTLDELIDAESQKLDALKTHKQGLMQQLFPREGETVPRLRFPEFEGAPEWEEKPLSAVADYENGKMYEPHIVTTGRYIVVNSRFISTDGVVRKFSNEALCIAKRGDVLMVLSDLPKGRALAKCFFAEADDLYAVNQRVCRLEPRSVNSRFLYFLLNRHPKLLAYDDGLNQTHLKKDAVLQCPLVLPPDIREQECIGTCLAFVDEIIAEQSKRLMILQSQKQGLMQQLFPALESVDG